MNLTPEALLALVSLVGSISGALAIVSFSRQRMEKVLDKHSEEFGKVWASFRECQFKEHDSLNILRVSLAEANAKFEIIMQRLDLIAEIQAELKKRLDGITDTNKNHRG